MKIIYFRLLCLSLCIVSCSKDEEQDQNTNEKPVVAFSYSTTDDTAPVRITFANQSQNATSWIWDFGDGTSSTDPNPVHLYTTGGTYQIKLIAFNETGSNTAGVAVVINPPFTSCRISKILLMDAPFVTATGAAWDSASDPDLVIRLYYRNTQNLLYSTGMIPDADSSQLPLAFSITPPYLFPSLTQEYDMLLFDDDSPQPAQLMGGYFFRLADATTIDYHYPDTMQLFQNGSELNYFLLLQWGY